MRSSGFGFIAPLLVLMVVDKTVMQFLGNESSSI